MQVVNGQIIGAPGPAGASSIFDLYGAGNPSQSTDPNVIAAAIGSTYRRIDAVGANSTFFVREPGGWVAK